MYSSNSNNNNNNNINNNNNNNNIYFFLKIIIIALLNGSLYYTVLGGILGVLLGCSEGALSWQSSVNCVEGSGDVEGGM